MSDTPSLDEIFANINDISSEAETEAEDTESIMTDLGTNASDYIEQITQDDDFDSLVSSLTVEDAPAPQVEQVSTVGAFLRGIRDSIANDATYALTRGSTSGLVTAGTRKNQLGDHEIAYSFGNALGDFGENLAAGLATGTSTGVVGTTAGPLGTVLGALAGLGSGYSAMAAYQSVVNSAMVFKDSYNEALDKGYGESDAFWEAFEKSGATFGLEYLTQFIPLGKAAKSVMPGFLKTGVATLENGIVKVLDKEAFKKIAGKFIKVPSSTATKEVTKQAAKGTAKEATKQIAKDTTKGTTKQLVKESAKKTTKVQTVKTLVKLAGKEGAKGSFGEGSEEVVENLAHQGIEFINDPNKTEIDWNSVWEDLKAGGFVGGALRMGAPYIAIGTRKGVQPVIDTKDRIKYGKKVSEEITNIDDKKITVNAREKTIDQAKKAQELESAVDKQSIIITDRQNRIIDSEGKEVSYTDVKDDDFYTFRNKEGIDKSVSGREAKQLWKEEYAKNKEAHKKQIIVNEVTAKAFNDLFSIKNNEGEDVTNLQEDAFNPEDTYTVTFGDKVEEVSGIDVATLRGQYLEEVLSNVEEAVGLKQANTKNHTVSKKVGQLLDQLRLQQNNVADFYNSHKVIDLDTNTEVAPNEIKPQGRYKVIHNGGMVVEDNISGLGVSILEKYSPSNKSGNRTPVGFNLGDSIVDFAKYGSGKINKNTLTIQSPDGVKEFRLQGLYKNGWRFTDWNKLDPNKEYRLFDSNNNAYKYSADQLKAIGELATRNADIADPEFISENILRNSKGEVVDWNNVSDLDFSERYSIEHKGTLLGENLSSRAVSLYRSMAQNAYVDEKNNNTYIYIKASSEYKGAPGTLYVRANDPTNTTYIGDNTDLLADTKNDYERELLTQKQKEDTRRAILKAIQEQKDNQSESSNEQLNEDEKGINRDHQAKFSGGANPETFAQIIEGEWSDDFIFSKPDVVVDSVATITRTLKQDHENLLDIYGPTIKQIVNGTNTERVSKEHIRTILSGLAQKLGFKMLNDLDTKGMASEINKQGYKRKEPKTVRVTEQVYGQMDAKRRYFRIRNSRDYFTGLHELAHGIFQDGLFGIGNEGVKAKLSATSDMHTFIKEMSSLFINGIKNKAPQQLDTSIYDPNKLSDAYNRIAEDEFAEAVMMLGIDENFEAVFKQYAPKTFEALDAYLTETNSWNDIKDIQKVIKAYKGQSSLDRAIADATVPEISLRHPIQSYKDTIIRQLFSPTWWKNMGLKHIWAKTLAYTTDDMAGLRYATTKLGVISGTDMPELYKSLGNDFAHRMLYGDGCNFSGQSLRGIGYVNLKETFDEIFKEFGKEGEATLSSLLWAQQTIAAYVGNTQVLTKLKQLSSKLNRQFTQVFSIMRNISNENWLEFINKEETKASDIKNLPNWEKNNPGLTAQEVADLINEFKKEARKLITKQDKKDAEKVLANELSSIKAEQDLALRASKLQAWRENVIQEALRKNFKQLSKADVANTGLELLDAIKIYDNILTFGDHASLYARAADNYHKYQAALRNLVAGASSEMKFLMDRFETNSSDWYVPLLRYFDTHTGEEETADHYLMTTRLGSDRAVKNLFENTIKETVTLCNAATRSALKNFMIEMADLPGSGFYIRELNEPVAKSKLTIENLKESITNLVNEKKQEITDRGGVITTNVEDRLNDFANELAKLQIAAFDVFTPTQSLKETTCTFSYYDPNLGQMRFFETEPEVYQALQRTTYSDPSSIMFAKTAFKLSMAMMKLGLITVNPVFLLFTNPVRDILTLSWKGDTPLIRTGNRFFDSNILNTVPGAILQVSKIYMDWILNLGRPDSFQLMDYFGVGYNTRMNTWRTMQQNLNYKDKNTVVLSSNPLTALLQISKIISGKFVDGIERLGSLDKLARLAQLEAMLKRDGLVADNFNVNRRNVAAMVLEKQVLKSNGITDDIIKNNLTDDQKTIWNNTEDNEAPILNLTENQIQNIYNEINPADIHEFTPEQRMKYAKAIRMCTTDFARGGTLLRGLNRVFLFTQPAFNGTAQSLEILKDRVKSGHADEVLANMITAFASGIAAGYLFPDEEDETEDNLLKGITFKIGDTTIRLPGLPEDLIWYHLGRYMTYSGNKDYGKFVEAFIDAVNPLKSGQGPAGLVWSLITGKRLNDLQDSRFGQSIVPDYMNKQYGSKHPELLYNESTSWLARTAGRFISNPMTLQYMLDQTGFSVIDRMVENLLGVHRVTRTQAGIDIQNNVRRWRDFGTSVGVNTKTFKTRSQEALQNLLKDAYGDYYYAVPDPYKRKTGKGLTREQTRLRNNYLALNQINKTISIYNKLESIAQRIEDRDAIHKDKIAYMKNMIRALEKIPGLEGKYYYQLSNIRKRMQNKLTWRERALSNQAIKEQKEREKNPGLLQTIWQETLGTKEANADVGEGQEFKKSYNAAGKYNLIKNTAKDITIPRYYAEERTPQRVNSKGVSYTDNRDVAKTEQELQKTLKENIRQGVTDTINYIARNLEKAPRNTTSSIRKLTVEEVLNNRLLAPKIKSAYKDSISLDDVKHAVADTLSLRATSFPATAKFEAKGKMWTTKPASQKITLSNGKTAEVGGYGIYQLDPFAKGGNDKMYDYITTSSFSNEFEEAIINKDTKKIDYNKLSTIWKRIAQDPLKVEDFTKDYEAFMKREYLPQSLLDTFSSKGFDTNNPNVKDAIFGFNVQRPKSALTFAKSLPDAAANSVTNKNAIKAIIKAKKTDPVLRGIANRFNAEEDFLLAREK